MMPAEPILVVLLFSGLAAAVAGAGVLPAALLGRVPLRALGWAYALASGLMLGAGYLLMAEGLMSASHLPYLLMLGAGLGVGYTYWTHSLSGTGEIETIPSEAVPVDLGYKILLMNALHSASEGLAIGVGMVVNLRMGIFLALSLALHNVAEAMNLAAVLRMRGVRLGEAAVLCVIAKVPQVLLAVATFAVVYAAKALLPWALGFASGALVYLVLTELLPASYQRAGHTSIAVLVSLSAGLVVLLKGFFA